MRFSKSIVKYSLGSSRYFHFSFLVDPIDGWDGSDDDRLGQALSVLDDALARTVDLAVFQDELAIDHGRLTLAAFETLGRIVPVHLAVTDPRLFRPDGPAAFIAILQHPTGKN